MKIRLADKRDVVQIKILLDRNFDEVMSKYHSRAVLEKFKSHNTQESLLSQMKRNKVYVAEDASGKVVATGAFADFGSEGKPKYCVSNFYVMPENHSQGIGRALFNELYREAETRRAVSFHVPSSRNAVGFYEKMGFAVDEDQPDAHDEITWMTMSGGTSNG